MKFQKKIYVYGDTVVLNLREFCEERNMSYKAVRQDLRRKDGIIEVEGTYLYGVDFYSVYIEYADLNGDKQKIFLETVGSQIL